MKTLMVRLLFNIGFFLIRASMFLSVFNTGLAHTAPSISAPLRGMLEAKTANEVMTIQRQNWLESENLGLCVEQVQGGEVPVACFRLLPKSLAQIEIGGEPQVQEVCRRALKKTKDVRRLRSALSELRGVCRVLAEKTVLDLEYAQDEQGPANLSTIY